MRRHRRRRQLGLHCVTVLIRKAEIDALIRKGFLTPEDKRDRKALVEALHAFFYSELCDA